MVHVSKANAQATQRCQTYGSPREGLEAVILVSPLVRESWIPSVFAKAGVRSELVLWVGGWLTCHCGRWDASWLGNGTFPAIGASPASSLDLASFFHISK